ncbi:MAG: nucleotidyl transferase AbiEii/AbiGii toxin family protein [Muribaculaceae bacterium]|nr:nucleotidyl transferase AbiEii/AbiGii toxin family protein [Muribaculaceae bacterium]MDE6345779.1 nucleotidyl transferase AbiEii/AbiGii toxin family protein [Muribaculaceae bacterium]
MSRWIDASDADRQQSAYIMATRKNISVGAVEKDWWVTAILKVLFSLSPAKYMFFKGGTSLSKGWNLIDRFSEDIDIALYRDFYLNERGKECAKATTNNQVKNLRIVNRDYILGEFAEEFRNKISEIGLGECKIVPIITKNDGTLIDHDSDPVVIEIHYPVMISSDEYVRPVVKIEISCLSMKEPYEVKRISSLVGEAFPQIDDETIAEIPTITPSRTFLEKAFLLNEEYQRKNPRTERMSRHLYDLERLMDTQFASEALMDKPLYNEIIAHRRRFYHVGGVDYELNRHSTIKFCPAGELRNKMRMDYEAMKSSMIYGDKLSFDALISRLQLLQDRFNSR